MKAFKKILNMLYKLIRYAQGGPKCFKLTPKLKKQYQVMRDFKIEARDELNKIAKNILLEQVKDLSMDHAQFHKELDEEYDRVTEKYELAHDAFWLAVYKWKEEIVPSKRWTCDGDYIEEVPEIF